MRTNIVGTTCVWVTLWVATAARNASGSNFSITTTVAPLTWLAMQKRRGAAW